MGARCTAVWVCAGSLWLAACGGGGGAPGPGGATPSATTDPYAGFAFDASQPTALVDPDTASYMASLSGQHSEPSAVTFPISVAFDGRAYLPSLAGGSMQSDLYLSPLNLPAVSTTPLYPSTVMAQGYTVRQYTGGFGLGNNSPAAYAVSIQTLSDSGIGVVGLGQWKYQGYYRQGYFGGREHARGAFLIGQPTPQSQVASVPAGSYVGFAQGGGETTYFDTMDQVTAHSTVYFDASAQVMTVRLSGFEYHNSYFGSDGTVNISWSLLRPIAVPGDATICAGAVSPSGLFTATCHGGFVGSMRGKFFGARGQLVAGTYSLNGMMASVGYGDALVGGFVAQRHVAIGEPVAPAADAPTMSLDRTDLAVEGYVSNASGIQVQLSASAPLPSGQTLYAAAFDESGQAFPHVDLTANGTQRWELHLGFRSTTVLGERHGVVTVRVCTDDPLVCAHPVKGSPWALNYRLHSKVYPGPNLLFTPSALSAEVMMGDTPNLGVSFTLDELPVSGDTVYGDYQYRYTIDDDDVFTALQPTDLIWNRVPSTFQSSGGFGFKLKPNLIAGTYDGVIHIRICGVSFENQLACQPTEYPVVDLPYHVRVLPAQQPPG